MSVCIKTRVIYQVQHFSVFVCCMFRILCYFKNAFKRLQRELKHICSRIGHMAGFYCTLLIPGGIYECTFLQNYVKFTSCCNLIHSANMLESFGIYITNLIFEKMGKQRITTIDFNDMKKVVLCLDQPVRWTFFHIYL